MHACMRARVSSVVAAAAAAVRFDKSKQHWKPKPENEWFKDLKWFQTALARLNERDKSARKLKILALQNTPGNHLALVSS